MIFSDIDVNENGGGLDLCGKEETAEVRYGGWISKTGKKREGDGGHDSREEEGEIWGKVSQWGGGDGGRRCG
ncbi:hypothetical protein L6452_05083 [Arctium lappa]|uniref:Uncharacterized protein n=1 Tax=Arctium lappa TaxID=4217 RepID=A0ACB9EG35_ARCLA|nr:hypothetical protein L6452_05083 [Arctium lappa]